MTLSRLHMTFIYYKKRGFFCFNFFFCPLLVSIIWVVLVCLLLFSRPSSVGAAPICINDQAGCSVPSLANLFDRVIQHSARMHSITNDLHSVFVSMYMQYMFMYLCIVILFSWQLFYENVKLEVCLILLLFYSVLKTFS